MLGIYPYRDESGGEGNGGRITTLVARGVQVGLLPGTWAIPLVSNIVSVFEYLMCKPVVPWFDYLLQTLSHLFEYHTTL